MIKVRILRGVTMGASATLALPVSLLPVALIGCGDDVTRQEDVGVETQNATESIAGSGVLSLHGYRIYYSSTSGGDEFVRVGEKMKVDFGHREIVDMIAYATPTLQQQLAADPSLLKVELRVRYTKGDGTQVDAPGIPVTWAQGASGMTIGTSNEFVVPSGIRRMEIELAATFDQGGIPQTVMVLDRGGVQGDIVVFGAYVPNKLALFDTVGTERRGRILEGGSVLRGASLMVSVTDWRLDTVVDKSSLDLYVGKRESSSRFGAVVVPAYGELEYEVAAAISTDGGASFQQTALLRTMHPDVLSSNDNWRYAYEGHTAIPETAGPSVKIAFHVRAFLKVPADGILEGRYPAGSRVLLRDVWDNNGGEDYGLPIAAQ